MKTVIALVVISLAPGCFFVSKKNNTRSNSQPSTSQPKNHGQQRSQEVHERNDARKDAKDAQKGK